MNDLFEEEGDGKKKGKRQSKTQSTAVPVRQDTGDTGFRPTLSNFSDNHKNLRPPSVCLPIFQQSSNRMNSVMKKRESFGSLGTPSKSPFGPSHGTKFAEEDDDDHLASFRFSPSPRSPRPKYSLGSVAPPNPLTHVASMASIGEQSGAPTEDGGEDEMEDEFVTWTVLVAGMR